MIYQFLRALRNAQAALILSLGITTMPALAEEVPTGFVLSAQNLDEHLDDHYQGTPINELLTEHLIMRIREHGLRIKLAPARPMQPDSRYIAATKTYAPKVGFDTQTKTPTGYVAGIPFPKLDLADPLAGWKLAWNLFYAIPTNADNSAVGGPITIAHFDKGIVRQFVGDNYKFRMVGRYTDEPPGHRGDGTIKQKSVVALSAPYDLAGLGVYTVQSAQGKADEAYVYVKSIRRIKRTAGAAVWMDNQPQMDMLNDDNNGIDSYPLWYSDFRILGKRTILAVSYLEPMMSMHYEDLIEQSAPWINPNPEHVVWRPTEVYVLEGTPPSEHPYGRKILYVGTDYPQPYAGEFYDKNDELWRMWRLWITQSTTPDGYTIPTANYVQAIDLKAQRATFIDGTGIMVQNDPQFKEEMLSPRIMERLATGKQGLY
ncbi:hypothetical protein Pstu01_13940 [Stutzerimonas stutzeri]|uniref:DUF1329 domain-containing protein n=1 Tax=Stutzerimonas stutzeri TaxID=316 RepID=UPI0024A59A9A|nr:DUF1329 domain-containing protein [Stutzerimonas stutzeri]GLZ24724.1 hypothetical protein Pstu01_13940 [Stutzerimonas stutzeri]